MLLNIEIRVVLLTHSPGSNYAYKTTNKVKATLSTSSIDLKVPCLDPMKTLKILSFTRVMEESFIRYMVQRYIFPTTLDPFFK